MVSSKFEGVNRMIYTKPELDIEKFDILEEIMAEGVSAIGGNEKTTGIVPRPEESAVGPDDGNLMIG